MPLQNMICDRLAKLIGFNAKPDLPVFGLVVEIVIDVIRLDDLQRKLVRVVVTPDESNQNRSVARH